MNINHNRQQAISSEPKLPQDSSQPQAPNRTPTGPKNWEDQARPMLQASNIHYEMAPRVQGINCGGIGAMHLMVQRLGLVRGHRPSTSICSRSTCPTTRAITC